MFFKMSMKRLEREHLPFYPYRSVSTQTRYEHYRRCCQLRTATCLEEEVNFMYYDYNRKAWKTTHPQLENARSESLRTTTTETLLR